MSDWNSFLATAGIAAASPEFRRDWKRFSVGDVNEQFVREAIDKYIPRCFALSKVPPDGMYKVVNIDLYGKYPWCVEEWSIALFRRDDPQFNMINAVGLGGGRKCTVSWIPTESEEVLGLRIWHEMLHASGVDSDQMVKNDRVEFTAWLKTNYPAMADEFEKNYMWHEHDPNYQRYYYKMLTEKLSETCKTVLSADFVGEPRSGKAPLEVIFTDKSTGYPSAWLWTFAGVTGMYADTKDVVVTYTHGGNYDVSLTAMDLYGVSRVEKLNYIAVQEDTPPPSPSLWERFIAFLKKLFGS